MKTGSSNKIAFIDEAHASTMRKAWNRLCLWWRRIGGLSRRQPRHLRLGETLSLGDHRFVAVIEFESYRFLVGGTSTSLALLTRLDGGSAAQANADAIATEPKETQ